MLDHEHDTEIDAHYFGVKDEHGFGPLVWRTEALGQRSVNIDYDAHGNVVGVEVI
jgi:uncharacterized protein YuzE